MRRFMFIAMLTILAPFAATAEDLPFAKRTEYSADLSYSVGEMQGSGKVYQGKTADRREVTMQGQKSVMIIKNKELLMIMPGVNMAMRMPMKSDPLSAVLEPDTDMTFTRLGTETVNGEKTIKYLAKHKDGSGHFWTTEDGVIMRVEFETGEGKFMLNTTNVKRGPQPASLFELPPGVQVMDMGSFGKVNPKGGGGFPFQAPQ